MTMGSLATTVTLPPWRETSEPLSIFAPSVTLRLPTFRETAPGGPEIILLPLKIPLELEPFRGSRPESETESAMTLIPPAEASLKALLKIVAPPVAVSVPVFTEMFPERPSNCATDDIVPRSHIATEEALTVTPLRYSLNVVLNRPLFVPEMVMVPPVASTVTPPVGVGAPG